MPNYGQIDSNGKCINVIYSETDPGSGYVEIPDNVQAGYGYTYDSATQNWQDPVAPASQNQEIASERLKKSDWTQLPDVGLTLANVAEWRTYRAALRSIATNPQAGNIEFPEEPSEDYS